jgi:hypothetical protein
MCELKNTAAAVAEPQQQLPHVAAAERVEARHRLVEEHDVRVVDDGLRDADALLHPLRVGAQAHAAFGTDAHLVEHPRDTRGPLAGRHVEQAREVGEQFFGAEVVVEGRVFREEADTPAHLDIAHRTAQMRAVPLG